MATAGLDAMIVAIRPEMEDSPFTRACKYGARCQSFRPIGYAGSVSQCNTAVEIATPSLVGMLLREGCARPGVG